MANQICARQHGDEYQQLVFLKYALNMLNDDSEIEKIYYETDSIKSFDDIVIQYSKPQKFRDFTITKEFMQVKFHMRNSHFFTIDNLLNPSFINSSKKSLLDKVVEIYRRADISFADSVFTIYSIFRIDPTDPLYGLIRNVDNTIDLSKLFDNTSDLSKMGKVRKKLRETLKIDEKELKCILSHFKIMSGQEGLEQLIAHLNQQLTMQSLKIIPG